MDENGNDTAEPIVFSECAFITGTQMQRKDYTFDEPQPDEEGKFLKQYISDYRRVQDNCKRSIEMHRFSPQSAQN